jgi:YbbR domain-containing protein
MTTSPVREFFRGLFFENLGLKLISLVCACGFFAFMHGEPAQRTFSVPVVSLMPPPSVQRMVVKPPPPEIAVTLSGPKSQLDALSGKDLGTVQLDLRTGLESTVQLKSSMFSIPPGFSVEQIFPSQIEIKWDDIIHKKVPVQIAWTGEPPPGFIVKGQVVASPESIEATGPRAVIDVIQYARAEAYNVSGLTEGAHPRTLDLDPPPQQVVYSADRVTATVDIVREEHMVPFKNIPVEVVGAPKATTKPPTVIVKVRGSPDVVNSLQADQIVPRVELPSDIDLTKPGSRFLTVTVDVAGATTDVDPPKVLVKW